MAYTGRAGTTSLSRHVSGSGTGASSGGIYDHNLSRTRGLATSLSAFALLFGELVRDAHTGAKGIQDLEQRLSDFGYHVGLRVLELTHWREKTGRRETRILGILQFIHTNVWRLLFRRPADALEKSNENADEYMILENEPVVNKFISVPKEMSQLNCAAFTAGIIEAILDGAMFTCRVTAHSVPTDTAPGRTVYLIKFDESVLEREEYLK